LKSDRIVGVGGMQILNEERRLYGAESEINTEVFLKRFWKIAMKLMKDKRSTRKNVNRL
jgi:hypothetical protein